MCGNPNGKCRCKGAKLERFIQPCILLLLFEKTSYGYELMENLKEFGFVDGGDSGLVYRTLKKLEEEGFIESQWETEGPGAAKKLYRVTEQGINHIHNWSNHIEKNINRLQYFIKRYKNNFDLK